MKLFWDILRKKGSFVIVLAGLAVVVAVGALLVHFVFSTTPPDVSKAELSKIARFTESEAFLKMSSKDRVDFIDGLLARYLQMTPEERERARSMFRGFRSTRATREAFWMNWVNKRSTEFEQLPVDERDAYIDRWLDIANVLSGGEMQRQAQRAPRTPPSAGNMDMPSRSDVEVERQMKQVLTKTSAKDRQRAAKLSGAVIRRLRERYGR